MSAVVQLRDVLLERVKRPAIRLLHATPSGEAVLLRIYLEGEEHAERAVLLDRVLDDAPAWLRRWLDRHRADEERHASIFRARLHALGRDTAGSGLDPISRWKLQELRRLGESAAGHFRHGLIVPLLAVAWRMERMGVRVFERHVAVLDEHAPRHATLALLRDVLKDERAHEAACRSSLEKLVEPSERAALDALVRRIDRVERAFGVCGALLLLTLGGYLWTRARLASFTSRSPTHAGT